MGRAAVVLLACSLVLTGCSLDDLRARPLDPDSQLERLGVDEDQLTETASGLRYADVAEGTGAPARAGDVVNVHYTGRLTDGSEFDSSRNRGPLSFRIGEGRVIPGWEEGLQGVRVGGKRLLVIPPGLAYGARGAPPVIPPNATLVFEVERVP